MIRAQRPCHSTASKNSIDSGTNGPELTPLIDIIFIVVVFLLLTANARILSIPVDIPSTDSEVSSNLPRKDSLNIAIRAEAPFWQLKLSSTQPDMSGITSKLGNSDETLSFESWAEFKSALVKITQEQDLALVVASDADASSERLIKLLALLNEQQLIDAHILMEPETP